jgi:hypothetical protein
LFGRCSDLHRFSRAGRGVDPTIFKGTTFTCDLTINGHKAQATVTFIDDHGTYSVGRPE